ncbi:MAG: 2,3-bisphosphoglycerate-dependent phosphoglycerate mutase [Hyphomicrobiales bacterium]
MNNVLVLVRHGESEWNRKNLFTGWRDVDLSETGIEEARKAGRMLKAEGVTFDIAFTSALKRAQRTLSIILDELGQQDLKTLRDQALNERDYGDLSGLDKAETAAKYGDEQVHIWRRSFDVPPPGGESLKDTAERVLPYFDAHIMPELMAGRNVIVAAHGNSLRALIMKLDKLSPETITRLNLATGVPMIYRLNKDGSVAEKRDLAA